MDGRAEDYRDAPTVAELGRRLGEAARAQIRISAYAFFDLTNPTLTMDTTYMWNDGAPRGETWRAFVGILPHLERALGPLADYFAEPGGVFDLNARIGQATLERTRLYEEFWRPTKTERQVVATIAGGGAPRAFLAFCRSVADPPFTDRDLRSIETLRQVAARWYANRFGTVNTAGPLHTSLRALAQGLPVPAALLDDDGRLLWLNQEAARRLGVTAASIASVLAVAEETREVEALRAIARDGDRHGDGDGSAPGLRPGEKLVVHRVPSGPASFVVLVTFVPDADSDGGGAPPPSGGRPPGRRPNVEDVVALGLSPREADVALLGAEGFSIAEIAERLGIAENTVQTHLKRLYRKLGVSSRAQLAWRLLSGPSGAADGRPAPPDGRPSPDDPSDPT